MTPRWKIARDPYLSLVEEEWGEAAVFEAGWFEDDATTDAPLDDLGWLCTPTAKVRRAIDEGRADGEERRPLVLVATGGFFPVHPGHLGMMAAAKAEAERAGHWVVGGYLSPAHDAYLRYKGAEPILPAPTRLQQIADELADDPWLDVDPWEAQARSVAVNYTDVTARLEAFLRAQVDPDIDVWFACGGDNARFSLAFALRGGCIVASRAGNEAELAKWKRDPRVNTRRNILWTEGTHDASSTALRPVPKPEPTPGLHLRCEPPAVAAHLGIDDEAWTTFQAGLLELLQDLLPVEPWPDHPAARVVLDGGAGLLSLDPAVPGDADLGLSRLFDLGGRTPLGHVERPGWPPLDEQFAALPPGEWTLLDDDRATGSTHRYVVDHLPDGTTVTATVTSIGAAGGSRAGFEIADARDFLPGTRDGGLVVQLPDGSVGRAPYLLPYVDPASRAGIPAEHSLGFSRTVWELAAAAFEQTTATVADLPDPTKATFRAARFTDDTKLTDLCRAHAAVLSGLDEPERV